MTLDKEIDKGMLWKGIIGISPIPVVGEIGLSMLFYDLFDKSSLSNFKLASIPAALLTRYVMYKDIYLPLYEKAIEFFR